MAVSFELPQELERGLRTSIKDLDSQAKEAFLVDLYRRGQLSHLALSRALGLDRLETDDVLHKHNVTEDLGDVAEYLADAKSIQQLRNSES